MISYTTCPIALLTVWLCTMWKELHVVLENQGCLGIHIHFLRIPKVTFRTQILQLINFFISEVFYPGWSIIFVGFFYIETPSFNIYRQKGVFIHRHDLKTGLFSRSVELIGSHRSHYEIHAYRFFLYNVPLHLPLLVMIMCRHTPAHYVLVPVHEGMPSLAELAVALVEVGDVGEHDGWAAEFFQLGKFFFQPGENLCRLLELSILLKIVEKAEIRVKGDYTCVFAYASAIFIL